jgi:tryptophan synthase alpha chain
VSRIETRFGELAKTGRRALITFITAGDPTLEVTLPLMHALVKAGADIIELGVPFSDPMADGPVIQLGNERALVHGVTLEQVMELVVAFRAHDQDTPVVLMGYLNPVEAMGYERAATRAAEAGVDGFIVVDMPPEEASDLHGCLTAAGVDLIFLLAPNSDESRIRAICDQASGFVYYVSLKGVTGAGHLDVDGVAAKVSQIKGITTLPVGVGFGIRDGESAASISRVSDAVVVGSALVSRVAERIDDPESIPAYVAELVSSMRAAMDSAA